MTVKEGQLRNHLTYIIALMLMMFGSSAIAGSGSSKDSLTVLSGKTPTANSISHSLADVSFGKGEKQHFDVKEVLSAGGDGKNFTVYAGGNVKLTSGKSVRLLPGTRVESGGNLIVKVNPGKPAIRKRKTPAQAIHGSIAKVSDGSVQLGNLSKVYPLPESETLISAMSEVRGVLPYRVQIYGNSGNTLYKRTYTLNIFNIPALSGLNRGKNFQGSQWGEFPGTISILRT